MGIKLLLASVQQVSNDLHSDVCYGVRLTSVIVLYVSEGDGCWFVVVYEISEICVIVEGKFGWALPSVHLEYFVPICYSVTSSYCMVFKRSWKYELAKMLHCVVLAAVIRNISYI